MTTRPRLVDHITAIAGSLVLSGFAPFFAPLMFFLNDNLWPTITLMVSLAAILLTTLVMVGRCRRRIQADGTVRLSLSIPGYAELGWRPFARNSRLLRGADRHRMHL